MGPYNKFAVIVNIKNHVDYGTKASKDFKVIRISDDFVNKWVLNLMEMPTFWHKLSRPNYGLARYGVTLIPPESLSIFLSVIEMDKEIAEVQILIEMIKKASTENKYIIHFGI